MITLNKILHSIIEKINANSDDSKAEYPLLWLSYLVGNKRAFLIKQQYQDARKEIPNVLKQTVCLKLDKYDFDTDVCIGSILKSTSAVPQQIDLNGRKSVSFKIKGFNIFLNYVQYERFKFVGENNKLKNQLYFTLDENGYVFVKANNEYYKVLEDICVTGVFQDPLDALLGCDPNMSEYPIEASMLDVIEQLIFKDLAIEMSIGNDNVNNSQEETIRTRQ